MGFTPAGGIMMGTRSGDLDPGLLLYLLEEKGYKAWSLNGLSTMNQVCLASQARAVI